jgi:hypothetical protein
MMTDSAREILRDSFNRLIEHVDALTEGLSDEVSFFRPVTVSGQQANSIAWLIWHSALPRPPEAHWRPGCGA